MVGQLLPKSLEPEVQQILFMSLTVRLACGALHAVVNQFDIQYDGSIRPFFSLRNKVW
jgi:hypothetical protein